MMLHKLYFMLTAGLLHVRPLCGSFFFCRTKHTITTLPLPKDIKVLETHDDMIDATWWTTRFSPIAIPRSRVDLQFARSSGPGGQNVNKVNTKAVVRCSLDNPWIPSWAKADLIKSRYYASSSHCLQVTSTLTRSQAQNTDDCLTKLHDIILSAAKAHIKLEPSREQKKKVEKHQAAEKARRKFEKMRKSDVKRSRSNNDW